MKILLSVAVLGKARGIVLPLAFLFVPLLFCSGRAQGQIYQWTDKGGTTHFTDDLSKVPKGDRAKVSIVPEEITSGGSGREPPTEIEEPGEKSAEDLSETGGDANVEREKNALQKRIEEDSAALEDLSRAVNRIYPIWKRAPLLRQKERLENRIQEEKKALEEIVGGEAGGEP